MGVRRWSVSLMIISESSHKLLSSLGGCVGVYYFISRFLFFVGAVVCRIQRSTTQWTPIRD